MDSADNI